MHNIRFFAENIGKTNHKEYPIAQLRIDPKNGLTFGTVTVKFDE